MMLKNTWSEFHGSVFCNVNSERDLSMILTWQQNKYLNTTEYILNNGNDKIWEETGGGIKKRRKKKWPGWVIFV